MTKYAETSASWDKDELIKLWGQKVIVRHRVEAYRAQRSTALSSK